MLLTLFPDAAAQTARAVDLDLAGIAAMAASTTAAEKADLPWIKLAAFGDIRSPKNSLRNNANVIAISGVEGDYDSEMLGPDEAADLLRAAGVRALVYTSPSHTPALPRWRVLCPLSEPMPPAMRRELLGRVNHVLGGVLATESFTLSQGYYIGGTVTGAAVETYLVDGAAVDTLDKLPARYPAKQLVEPLTLPPARVDQSADERIAQCVDTIAASLGSMTQGRHQTMLAATLLLAPFVLSGHLSFDAAEEIVSTAMTDSGRSPNDGEVTGALRRGLDFASPYYPPTGGAEFTDYPPPAPPRKKLFTSRDFRLDAHKGYVVKGLLAPGNVGVLLGHPGAGKSTLAPFLAYAVAQGRSFFGLRTRPGRTLIIAAEDLTGTQKRVAALGERFGHTDDCAVVEVGNLREPSEMSALSATITDYAPVLVVLDTIAAAFAGMDENSSQDMGAVVSFARGVAALGPAVILIHHPAKAGDGSPRGHSSLNGTLDMVLTLAPDDVLDEDTIVRGTTPKNRQGSTAWQLAFRKQVVTLGHDDEGDAVTTTVPVEIDEAAERKTAPPKLTPQETAALSFARERFAEGGAFAEDEWIAKLASFSGASKPEDRTRSARRMHAKMVSRGLIDMPAGAVRPVDSRTTVGPMQGIEFM